MPKRKINAPATVPGPGPNGTPWPEAAPLTLGVELPPDPGAAKDWADDDETTAIGPVDDLQPIGRVTPVPAQATEEEQLRAIAHYEATGQPEFAEGAREGLRLMAEADEEPTLLGPNPTITEDDGDVGGPPDTHTWHHDHAKRVAFIDATAIALYGRGFPIQNCYTKAALLWEQRKKEGIR